VGASGSESGGEPLQSKALKRHPGDILITW